MVLSHFLVFPLSRFIDISDILVSLHHLIFHVFNDARFHRNYVVWLQSLKQQLVIALILMNNALEHLGKLLELRLVSNIVVVKINYFLAFSSAVEISADFVKKSESEN